MSSGRRFASLDGLRGAASLAVVLHHSFLTVPALVAVYYAGVVQTGSTAVTWLAYSPLHLLWGGTEAVYIFFVLSGFVLARAVGRSHFDWFAYFPSRLVRLYAPVIAAVALAAILIAFVPRVGETGNPWLAVHTAGYTPQTFLQDVVLLTGVSNVVTPLWSLQWEVLFSLLLPVFLLVAGRGRSAIVIALSIVLSTVGFFWAVPFLMYMPMFAIGVALASAWAPIAAATDRISALRLGHLAWSAVAAIGVLLLSSYWLLAPHLALADATLISRPLIMLGAGVLVVVAVQWSLTRKLLSTALFAWFGRISFSLYLVHEPIVVSLAFLFPEARWTVPVGVALAIGVAYLFYRLVERPSHRLAQRIKNSLTRRDIDIPDLVPQ